MVDVLTETVFHVIREVVISFLEIEWSQSVLRIIERKQLSKIPLGRKGEKTNISVQQGVGRRKKEKKDG